MPELPEVETIKRGILAITGKCFTKFVVRQPKLRYIISEDQLIDIIDQRLLGITRRAKYLIFRFTNNHYIIIHLGMSGRISLLSTPTEPIKHDHVDLCFGSYTIRYNDPRRFGCVLSGSGDYRMHKLLIKLGPEPLEKEFTPKYLFNKSRTKSTTLKQFLMDNEIVVGVGNIYACESLFNSKLSPLRIANSLTEVEASKLVKEIKKVLTIAIENGGSTLKDYVDASGNMGYFQQQHKVYGRSGLPCKICDNPIVEKRLGQRNSFYCTKCQN